MKSVGRKLAIRIQALLDLLMMAAGFLPVAYLVSRKAGSVSLGDFLSMRFGVMDLIIFAIFLFVWHSVFVLFGLYWSKRLTSSRRLVEDVLTASLLGSLAFLVMGRMFRVSFLTPKTLFLFWPASAFGIILGRLGIKYFLRALGRRGRNLSHLLIAGTNHRAVAYAKKVTSQPELGFSLVGFVENGRSDGDEFRRSGYEVVTDFVGFPAFIRTHVVDEVAVCLPIKSHYEQASRIVRTCEKHGIVVRFPSDLFECDLACSTAEMVDDATVLTLRTGAMHGWPLLVKRGMDVFLSAAALLLAFPLFAPIAVLIKLTSPGPVFFAQDRVGRNKRIFRLYKFRTMVAGADKMIERLEAQNEVSGPVFKIKNDPRITRIGKFLRKASIDELPQLLNVLKGDMSLVGPRPLPVRDYEGFDKDWQRRRFSVRPGITCLWQIGGRSNVSFDQWMGLDMEYIDNWTLFLDLKILMETIPAVLKGDGAS